MSLFPGRLLWYPKQQATHSFQPTNPNDNELAKASCEAGVCMHLHRDDDMGMLSDGLSNACILAVCCYALDIIAAANAAFAPEKGTIQNYLLHQHYKFIHELQSTWRRRRR